MHDRGTYLVSWGVYKSAIGLLCDGEEGHENVTVESSGWVLSRLVAHEAVDKGVGGWSNEYTSEWTVKEVWVVLHGVIKTLGAERVEQL